MSDTVQLLVPLATANGEACARARAGLSLPHLEKLLARLSPGPLEAGAATDLCLPHERVLARACGLPAEDGHIPFAAWQARQAGENPGDAAWAWLTPCHWQVAQDHIAMGHPRAMALTPAESQALLAAMQPYFAEDGLQVRYEAPTQWLAEGEVFRGLASASLDRVIGNRVDAWLPRAAEARTLRRLQQEMQMLLYTHPVNEERSAGGQLPVNSFWVSGAGALPPGCAPQAPAGLRIVHTLRDAAMLGDWEAWAAAWRQLDAGECAALLKSLDAGQPVTLTLCGERHARSWQGDGRGLLGRLAAAWGRGRVQSALQAL
ncbi:MULTISPECIES: phosphoglycerate mutase [Ramlibacter]|uniref:Phosphoglycerate mutase n=1 Tax=Ramlibacter aquaticus TaxID=2780094 RepID=A0ABR9SB17_9BURK|nr:MULTISPECIES: phosphoglycerate mutase [Ramlibacter]MBE7939277.1 phosphoglycerate mutase [Ramlibacter aquaticus]